MQPISSKTAIDLIIQGKPLINYHISDKLELYNLKDKYDCELIIENCIFDNLISPSIEFKHPVRLIRSCFHKCSFNYAYFIEGLMIDNCVFDSYLDFEAGGHNQKNSTITIKNSTFKGFVNFFDCWYQSKVVITDNDFEKGTNLLGNKDKAYRVQFDVTPIIENNRGSIDLDDEGDKIVNTIYLSVDWDSLPGLDEKNLDNQGVK
jgi:hypothetical protein